jgi:ER-bound oxygenase mpaB/B'/Rubber oxygenase, catalytic domain
MAYFIDQSSIIRAIWSNSDLVHLIFAGSAAEFALNRSVDWLFYTNQIPNDPVGRFYSTVEYAQEIVFADEHRAQQTLARICAIHNSVELSRGERIPEWAYRDVLYMLIDYSERAHELYYRPLTWAEKTDLYEGFLRIGNGLKIAELPLNYLEWRVDRELHLLRDLAGSEHTKMLYQRYRDQLGEWRFQLLLQLQALLAPARVRELLELEPSLLLEAAIRMYGLCAIPELRSIVHWLLLPDRLAKRN